MYLFFVGLQQHVLLAPVPMTVLAGRFLGPQGLSFLLSWQAGFLSDREWFILQWRVRRELAGVSGGGQGHRLLCLLVPLAWFTGFQTLLAGYGAKVLMHPASRGE